MGTFEEGFGALDAFGESEQARHVGLEPFDLPFLAVEHSFGFSEGGVGEGGLQGAALGQLQVAPLVLARLDIDVVVVVRLGLPALQVVRVAVIDYLLP